MEPWDHLENLAVWENLVHQDSQVLQELKEIWVHLVTKVV